MLGGGSASWSELRVWGLCLGCSKGLGFWVLGFGLGVVLDEWVGENSVMATSKQGLGTSILVVLGGGSGLWGQNGLAQIQDRLQPQQIIAHHGSC